MQQSRVWFTALAYQQTCQHHAVYQTASPQWLSCSMMRTGMWFSRTTPQCPSNPADVGKKNVLLLLGFVVAVEFSHTWNLWKIWKVWKINVRVFISCRQAVQICKISLKYLCYENLECFPSNTFWHLIQHLLLTHSRFSIFSTVKFWENSNKNIKC